MTYVVDASVALKWVVEEEGSVQAAELMRLPVLAPDLLIPECVNALWKKVRRHQLTEELARVAARTLRASTITFEPTAPLASEILSLSFRLDHPAYDCAYLALAQRENAVMITADEGLVTRCLRADAADLAPHIRSLHQVGREIQEKIIR